MEVFILEAKILQKLDRFDEALEIINKCIHIVDPNSVEVISLNDIYILTKSLNEVRMD